MRIFIYLFFFTTLFLSCKDNKPFFPFEKINATQNKAAINDFYWNSCRPLDHRININADTANYVQLDTNKMLDLKNVLILYNRIELALRALSQNATINIAPSNTLYITAYRWWSRQDLHEPTYNYEVYIGDSKNFEYRVTFHHKDILNQYFDYNCKQQEIELYADYFFDKKYHCELRGTEGELSILAMVFEHKNDSVLLKWLAIYKSAGLK